MNKKLKKYLEEGERTEAKIAELQEHLKSVHAAQKLEEDLEIVKSIRSMKLSGRDLFSLLCSLQDGTATLQTGELLETDEENPSVNVQNKEFAKEKEEQVSVTEPESEENEYEMED